MMKRVLCGFALLWLGYAPIAKAQTLTFDQLIQLNGKEQLDVDAYLVHRGWLFSSANAAKDSTFRAYWVYDSPRRQRLAELETVRQATARPMTTYSTNNRASFDMIRAKIAAYKMELRGSTSEDGLQTFYRGPNYDVFIIITNLQNGPNYHVTVQRHGLVKFYRENRDGTLTPEWIEPHYLNKITDAQARQLQGMIDSIAAKK